MKAEIKETLVIVLNEKITRLKSSIIETEGAITELETARAELTGDGKKQTAECESPLPSLEKRG